jgi:equilibrative nucleoside transporter 1/2/3
MTINTHCTEEQLPITTTTTTFTDTIEKYDSLDEKDISKSETLVQEEEPAAPKDRFRLVYLVFYLLGVGGLFPWNVFVAANNYFTARFMNTAFVDSFQNYFTISYMIAFEGILLVTLKFQQRWRIDYRVMAPLTLMLMVFLLSAIFVKVRLIEGTPFFYCNLVLVMVSGAASAFFQPGMVGFASQLPSIYVQATMAGQALAGVVVAAAGFFTSLGGDSNQSLEQDTANTSTSILIYFIVAILVIVMCILGFIFLRRHPLTIYYVNKIRSSERDISSQSLQVKDFSDTSSVVHGSNDRPPTISSVLKQIWTFALGGFFVYFVTLAVFPSVVVKIASVSTSPNLFNTSLFVPFGLLLFNLSDFIGRSLTGFQFFCSLPNMWHHLLTLIRVIFIPFFMLCNIKLMKASEVHTPHVFMNDALFFILYAIFGILNGYLGTLYVVKAPNAVQDDSKELVGLIMVLSLISGLTVGSFFSFFLRWLICLCNPFT